MNRHVNAIAGRLSLRAPQRRSLEVLDRITEIAPPKKDANIAAALEAIRRGFPSIADFEREFPSLCFGENKLTVHLEYQPDFVAETKDMLYMLEPKMRKELTAVDVLAKKEAAEKWCVNASAHAQSHKGKKWRYALIPHDVIAVNMTLEGLVRQHAG